MYIVRGVYSLCQVTATCKQADICVYDPSVFRLHLLNAVAWKVCERVMNKVAVFLRKQIRRFSVYVGHSKSFFYNTVDRKNRGRDAYKICTMCRCFKNCKLIPNAQNMTSRRYSQSLSTHPCLRPCVLSFGFLQRPLHGFQDPDKINKVRRHRLLWS
jgi:hypothetical protein